MGLAGFAQRNHPFHRIGSRKWETVQRDAKRGEVTSGIGGTVHPLGLFRCHVSERSSDDLGGSGDWRSRGRREAMPKPVSQTWPVAESTRILVGVQSAKC
jgi:hypothetical protein